MRVDTEDKAAPAGKTTGKDLSAELGRLPQRSPNATFGPDIDTAHKTLLDNRIGVEAKETELLQWIAKFQPCLFGRLAARSAHGLAASKGLAIDIAWLDEADLERGDDHAMKKVQAARRKWKDRAVEGVTSAFMIMFNSAQLANARPGPEFAGACLRLARSYLTEFGRLEADVIYTEAVPLADADGPLSLYKASTQIFYSGAHLMRNHDRRIPGGVAIVVNSPGHYARSLARRGLERSYEEAVDFVAGSAMRSIGNGGIGHAAGLSSSWHHRPGPTTAGDGGRRIPTQYAAAYQIDVLVQSDVVADPRPRRVSHEPADIWPTLHLDYISSNETARDDPDYGWFNGLPADGCARYHNPWPPRYAKNSPDFNY